jgi:hypothetical protein
MTIATKDINPNLIKAIIKRAEKENKDEKDILNKILEKGLETIEIEEKHNCEALAKELDELNSEIEKGECITITTKELAKKLGVDYP